MAAAGSAAQRRGRAASRSASSSSAARHEALDQLAQRLDPQPTREVVVERRDRLAEERRVVGQRRIGGDGAATGDLEIEPARRRLAGVERRGEAPGAPAGPCRSRTWAIFMPASQPRSSPPRRTITDVPRLQRKNFSGPDQVRKFPFGRVDIVNLDETAVGRFVCEPGWRWSEHVAPAVDTRSCENRHLGYAISGHLHVLMEDRTELDIRAGDAYEIPPGHDAWVVGDAA